MEKLLSIIIPCYNVENFILSCFEHLKKIPLQPNEYEIICYNDCSTDNTLNIIEEAAQIIFNIRVIQGTINIGPGGGRNVALKNAFGKYVWFVDADDIVLPEIISAMLGLIKKDCLDVIPFNYKDIDASGNVIAEPIVFKDTAIMNGLEFVEYVFQESIIYHMGYPWHFLVRREYLIQNDLFFPENIRYGEDTVWMPQILLLASKVASTSTFGYMYRHHSQSTCGMFDKSYPGRTIYERCFVASELLISFANNLEETIHDDRINKYVQAFRKSASHYYLGKLPIYLSRTSIEQRQVFFSYLKEHKYNKTHCPLYPIPIKSDYLPYYRTYNGKWACLHVQTQALILTKKRTFRTSPFSNLDSKVLSFSAPSRYPVRSIGRRLSPA